MSQRSAASAHVIAIAAVPSSFEVGTHVVRVAKVMEGRWTVSVDGAPCDSSYATQAEAWEAGVRAADRLDRPAASTA